MGESKWRRRFLRGLRWFMLVLLVLVPIGLVADWQHTRRLQTDLAAVTAELDAADPGWRVAEIEASRATIPDDENSATRCHSGLFARLGAMRVYTQTRGLPPQCLPTETQATAVRDLFEHTAP